MRRDVAIFARGCSAATVLSALQPPEQLPVFRTDTRLVEVSVVVHDKNGAAVSGLTREDWIPSVSHSKKAANRETRR